MVAQAENLGPAERVLNQLLTHTDHLYHNRPGMVSPDGRTTIGMRWVPVTHKVEGDDKVVYRLDKVGKKTNRVRAGVMDDQGVICEGGRKMGDYRPAGIFPEVAEWMYRSVAEVWSLDNEFSARWASYAYGQEHRDLKLVLAAFMLVQSRKGDPVKDEGETFLDDDYRDVGEAMMLIRKAGKDFNPKQLLRIRELLTLPAVAKINHDLGFGKSARTAFLGRWRKSVDKWLRYREQNPKMLEGLIKAGFRTTTMDLAQACGYKPTSTKFFEALRWKQKQAADGHRQLAIGAAVKAAESWEGLTEVQVCEKIMADKPDYKRIVGLLPTSVGVTRAVMAAAIEAGCLSDKDLIIQTPTLEELGLLADPNTRGIGGGVQEIRERWEAAVSRANDMRAANIARNVRSKHTQEKLQEGADMAVKAAVEEVIKDIRVYFLVDTSGSMEGSIEAAKKYLAQFLQGFPADKVHVATFSTAGREIKITRTTAAGVANAFRGIRAGGGTDHSSGVRALMKYPPAPEEDVLFVWVGDEGQYGTCFDTVKNSGLRPMAFGMVPAVSPNYGRGSFVRDTATRLEIPFFEIAADTFEDPYSVPRTIRNLIAATPVRQQVAGRVAPARKSLVDTILETELLQKPAWAA